MKIVIAPDSFKESMSSLEVCQAIQEGFMQNLPDAEYELVPIADGGEGMMRAVVDSLGGTLYPVTIRHPLVDNNGSIVAHIAHVPSKRLVIIESAEAVGLDIIPRELRNPLYTTTYGLGELLMYVQEHFITTEMADTILIGIGGTSTVDGGIGMLQAMGAEFFDAEGNGIGLGGISLTKIQEMNMSQFTHMNCEIIVASDVQNPLLGNTGAAHVFGPQKGATPEIVSMLEEGMQAFAAMTSSYFNLDKARDIDIPCAGAAGGLGMTLPIFCKARVQSGIETVMLYVGLDDKLRNADLVLTGEGKVDGQSAQGKVVYGVLQAAKKHQVPVCIIGGCLDAGYEEFYTLGAYAIFSATPMSCDWNTLKLHARENVYHVAQAVSAMMCVSLRKTP